MECLAPLVVGSLFTWGFFFVSVGIKVYCQNFKGMLYEILIPLPHYNSSLPISFLGVDLPHSKEEFCKLY